MPAKYLLCQKSGGKVTIEDCKVCDDRCLSLPTLTHMSNNREFSGKPSTTMCLQGTRESYLKITCDYTIDPFDSAFMLLGTRHHTILEDVAKSIGLISEEKLKGEVSGIIDLLEPTNQGGFFNLYDYKTSGSYAVAKALGIVKIWGKDDNPSTFKICPEKADMWDWELQTNNYRVMLEDTGLKISNIYIQCTVRDGGTKSAYGNGVMEKLYKIPVKRLADDYVKEYFKNKSTALLTALETKTIPPPCNNKENWNFRKCKEYCNVAEFCSVGIHQRGK